MPTFLCLLSSCEWCQVIWWLLVGEERIINCSLITLPRIFPPPDLSSYGKDIRIPNIRALSRIDVPQGLTFAQDLFDASLWCSLISCEVGRMNSQRCKDKWQHPFAATGWPGSHSNENKQCAFWGEGEKKRWQSTCFDWIYNITGRNWKWGER